MKHALVIAGSRGLGLGLVRELLARGWHVTATARTPSAELDALRREADERLAVESLDVTSVVQTAALAMRLGGQVFDLLLLNAGIMAGRGTALSEVPDSEIHNIFLTNAISPIRVADALAGYVVPGGDDRLHVFHPREHRHQRRRAGGIVSRQQGGVEFADPQLSRAPCGG